MTIRVNIIVGEGIALLVNLQLVNNPAVVVGWVASIILSRRQAWLKIATSAKQSRANKGSTKTGDNGSVNSIIAVSNNKRAAVA